VLEPAFTSQALKDFPPVVGEYKAHWRPNFLKGATDEKTVIVIVLPY
jgi:hypothetical protein